MNTWIDKDLVLTGSRVVLRPLQPAHVPGLIAAGMNPRIWEFLPIQPVESAMQAYYDEAFVLRDNGTQFPFVIFDKENNIIGTTRYGEIEAEHRKLEIGWTWYIPEIWGNGMNEECKHLLLTHAFEVLGAVRVQLKTSDKNYRSQRAIQRLGCKYEGVYRNHVIRSGVMRNSVMYSMLPEEWTMAKHNLQAIADAKYAGTWQTIPDTEHVHYNGYIITTNKGLMQPERIHQWLSTRSYWLPGVPYYIVKTAFDQSFCVAVLHNGVQIGYARFVTDQAIFAYLADVYIEEEHRGKGLSKKMLEVLFSQPWVKRLKKFALGTHDAHGLYRQFGYGPAAYPDRYMERTNTYPAW